MNEELNEKELEGIKLVWNSTVSWESKAWMLLGMMRLTTHRGEAWDDVYSLYSIAFEYENEEISNG